jgi:hypothetical protein
MKPRALDDEELATIEEKGLWNLKDFLPKEPSAEECDIIKKMFEASVNEEAYDPALWGNYYRPAGVELEHRPATTSTTTSASEDEEEVAENTSNKIDALAKLRERAATTATETPEPARSSGASKEDIMRAIRERAAK